MFSIIFRLFEAEAKNKLRRVLHEPNRLEVLQGMSVEFFAQNFEHLTCDVQH